MKTKATTLGGHVVFASLATKELLGRDRPELATQAAPAERPKVATPHAAPAERPKIATPLAAPAGPSKVAEAPRVTAAAQRAALRTVGTTTAAPAATTPAAPPKLDPVKKTLVIFGATGNLTAIKLLPALARLEAAGLLDPDMRIVGCSDKTWSNDEFLQHVRKQLSKESPALVDALVARMSFIAVPTKAEYPTLAAALNKLPTAEAPRECVFYPAVPDSAFKGICEHLAEVGLLGKEGAGAKNRLALEKPVGRSGDAARDVQKFLADLVQPENIAPVDHYPAKRVSRAILPIRTQFESVWDHRYISRIEVNHAETQGIHDRAQYFDEMGIMRDMVQSHLLQLLALLCMEVPTADTGEARRACKVAFLQKLRQLSPSDIEHNVVRGEYLAGDAGGEHVPNYVDEKGVSQRTRTETFVRIATTARGKRWQQVPICISAGKAMPENSLELKVFFRALPANLLPQSVRPSAAATSGPATLTFRVQPNPAVLLTVDDKTVELEMPPSQDLTDYSAVLFDVMSKEPKLTLHFDEILACWGFVDSIVRASQPDRMALYKAGTVPVAAALAERHDLRAMARAAQRPGI